MAKEVLVSKKADKDMQEEMDNTVHLELNLRDLPKDKAVKIKEVVTKERKEDEKRWKKEREGCEDKHQRRTKTILGLLMDKGASADTEASKQKEKVESKDVKK